MLGARYHASACLLYVVLLAYYDTSYIPAAKPLPPPDAMLPLLFHPQGRSLVAPPVVSQWKAAKAATEDAIKLLQSYKDIGDAQNEVGTPACVKCTPAFHPFY